MLDVRSLSVSRGRRTVLRALDLTVGKGEVVAVVGPNGAGKTTLLEAILGVVPHGGSVSIAGIPRASFAERAAQIGYVPDGMTMPEETTLARALGLDARGAWFSRLRVEGLATRRASETSRGELERAALAAVLDLAHATPARPVILLDEPFGALDPREVRSVLPCVREACAERAALVTIHQLSIAEKIADRIALLSAGTMIAVGTPAELRERANVSSGATLEETFLALLGNEDEHASHAPA